MDVASAELRIAENNLSALLVILQVAVIFSLAFPFLLAVFAGLYAREYIDDRVRAGVAEELKISQQRTHARIYNWLAVVEWRRLHNERDLDAAIRFAEGALSLADPGELDLTMSIKSNLAYYYAEKQIPERRAPALKYAAECRAYYDANPRPGLVLYIANDVYVRLQYARACDVKILAPLAIEIRELIVSYPELREELQDYLAELLQKCPKADPS